MKVLLISDNLMKGGKERRMLELLKVIDKKEEISADLVILKNKIEYPVVKEFKSTNIIVFKRKIKKDFTIFFKLFKLCRKNKYSLVHSWGSMPSIYVFLICKILRIPFLNGMISNAHCIKYSKGWLRAKITFPFSDIIIGNSWAGINAYNSPKKKSRVVYNGIHLDRFENLKPVNEIKANIKVDTKYIVGMVAAFHPRKDYKTFIDAAKIILRERRDITFLLIGGGNSLAQHKEMVEEDLSKNIIFLGMQDSVEDLINVFDLGVLLTNTDVHQEGISNSLIEYMSLRKPVIATNGGGTVELIEHQQNGEMVPFGDSTLVAERIVALLEDEHLRKKYSINARRTIENKFTIDKMTKEYFKLYKYLAN